MRTKVLAVALCAVMVVALLGGCGSVGGGGEIKATVTNNTGWTFNEIYLSPTASNEWGPDQLGGTNILKSSGSYEVTLEKTDNGLYDLEAVDEDDTTWTFFRVPLEKGSELVIHEDFTAVSISPKGDETTITGTLESAGGGDDYEDDYEDIDDGQGDLIPEEDDNWIEMVFYNPTSYDFPEIYVCEEGLIGENSGYNHVDAAGGLGADSETGIGVDWYSSYDVGLVDHFGDGWLFSGVSLKEGCFVSISNENGPALTVQYADGTSGTFKGNYILADD